VPVAHVCNPSDSRGRDQEDCLQGQIVLKNTHYNKREGEVTQGVAPVSQKKKKKKPKKPHDKFFKCKLGIKMLNAKIEIPFGELLPFLVKPNETFAI
jgi:hypothetical protein